MTTATPATQPQPLTADESVSRGARSETKRRAVGQRRRHTVFWYSTAVILFTLFVLPFALPLLAVFKSPAQAAATPAQYWPHPFSLSGFRQLFGPRRGHITLRHELVPGFGWDSAGHHCGDFAWRLWPGSVPLPVERRAVRGPAYNIDGPISVDYHPIVRRVGPRPRPNSLVGLALVYITYQLPFGLFVMRNSFASIPAGIAEAAEVDGASPMQNLWHAQSPLVVPGMLTVAIFGVLGAWNDFIAALILLSSQSKFTLPVILLDLVTGQFGVIQWGVLEAGVLISMVPCVVLFLVLQRYYLGGLRAGP